MGKTTCLLNLCRQMVTAGGKSNLARTGGRDVAKNPLVMHLRRRGSTGRKLPRSSEFLPTNDSVS